MAIREVIDGPGIFERAAARGQTRHQGIEAFTPKPIARQGFGVADIAEPNLRSCQKSMAVIRRRRITDARLRPNEAHDIVTAAHERVHRGLTDGAGGSENENPASNAAFVHGKLCVESGRLVRLRPLQQIPSVDGAHIEL